MQKLGVSSRDSDFLEDQNWFEPRTEDDVFLYETDFSAYTILLYGPHN